MRRSALLILAVPLLLAAPRAASAACANAGKDGPASVSGVVNSYYPGSGTVGAGSTSVAVGAIDTSGGGSSTPIAAGDLVVVMQMQDADISSLNSSGYGGTAPGSGYVALNNAGVYEYATVSASYAGGSPIPLTAPLQNTYRSSAYVAGVSGQRRYQVIRVPQYSAATLIGNVTAPPWNGSTGGVVVLEVAGNLNWNGQTVDVTARGFRGGGGLYLKGDGGAGQGPWVNTDYRTTLDTIAPTISPNPCSTCGPFPGSNAPKGEGIAGTPRYLFVPSVVGAATNGAGAVYDNGVEGYPNGSLARGAPGNAGGGGTDGDPQTANAGGNDQNTGGGGGGGYAPGGEGGYGWTPGTPPGSQTGGFGGDGVPMNPGRLTMGGGGGAGTTNNGTGSPNYGLASSGAPGGGVVVVRARNITGSGTINANGATANPNVCNDASGGGGAGGAVLVFAYGNNGNVGSLVVNANGGAGGNNTGNGTGENLTACGAFNNQPHGPGGGGGGFVALSSASSALVNVNGGSGGTTAPSATTGQNYGSSASSGGYQIYTGGIPGAGPSALCYPLLTVAKVTGQANTVQGGATSYTITVANQAGRGTATGLSLSDTLPVPFTYAATGTVTLIGGAVRTVTTNPAPGAAAPAWSTFTIPGGASVALTFTSSVPGATALGTYQNPANVTYDDPTRSAAGQTVTPGGTYAAGDYVQGSNYGPSSSAQEDVTVRAPAVVAKSFSPPSLALGGTTQLSITVTNPNAAAVSSAAFTDPLPAGLVASGGAVTVAGTGCTGFLPAAVSAGATSFAQSAGTIPANGSCTFTIAVTSGLATSFTNTIPAGAFTNALNVINLAPGAATLLARPTIATAFAPVAVATNTDSTLSFTIANPNPSQALTTATFTDTFPAGLVATGGAVTVAGAGCTGFSPGAILAGSTSFSVTGGTLPAGGTCTVSFAVRSATAGSYSTAGGGVTTTETQVAGNPSAAATLGVGVVNVAKAFAPARIARGGTSTVTLTLTNASGVAQTAGAFTDTLTGMAVSANQTVGGTCTGVTPSALTAGQTSLSFTGIAIPAAGCTMTFVVSSSTPGTLTNATSGVRTALLAAGPPSNTATLTVTGPPSIAAAFSPTTVQTGQASVATFTISNNDVIPLTGAAFTDALPAGLQVAGSGSVSAGGTCTGASSNAFTAGVNGATLAFSGLGIPAGGSCTVTIPLTSISPSAAAGYANSTGGVTANESPAGAGSNVANLVVAGAPTIAKAFGTSPVAPGGTSLVTFTLTNPSAIALTGARFTDALANLQVAAAGTAGGTCAGAGSNTFTAGQTGTLAFSGLTLPASGSCTVTVGVTNTTGGTVPNTASGVTTDQTPTAGAASNTASLSVYFPLQISLGFTPGLVLSTASLATSSTTLTVTLVNQNAIALTSVAFTQALASMQVYAAGAAGGTCAGASGNVLAAGATNLSFTGITVPAGGSCTVTFPVSSGSISPATGWPAATSGATSAQTPLAGPAPAPAYLTVVGYATVAKSFSLTAVDTNQVTTLTFTLTNPSSVNLTNATFGDTFPTNMTTSGAQTLGGTCAGTNPATLTATRLPSLTFTGITIPANSSCTILVNVLVTTQGNYSNTTTGVTANETGTGAGPVSNTATLGVGRVAISKAFSPASIGVGQSSTLTLQITNPNNTNYNNNVSFTDTLPAGMTVAAPPINGCGGTLNNLGTGIQLVNGTVARNSNCTITVQVTAAAAGSYANTTGAVTYGGNTGTVSNTAVLTVVALPSIALAFSPASADAYRNATMTFTVTNPGASALTGCTFSDTLTGFFVSNPAFIGGTCVGATNSPALAYGAAAIAITIPAVNAGSCTVSLPVTSGAAGSYSTAASGVKCNETASAGAASNSATVAFNKLPIQFTKGASVLTAAPGTPITYTMTYANPNAAMSLQGVVISDAIPAYTTFVSASCGPLPASITSCTISAPAVGGTGTVTWTFGGSLDAGGSGTVSLTVAVK